MFKTKAIIRLLFLGSILAWLVLVFSDITVLYSQIRQLPPGVPRWLPSLMLDLFIVCLFYYYRYRIEKDESLSFTDLLWKVFATGLIATVVSLVFRLGEYLLGTTKLASDPLFKDFIYQINLALFLSFLLSAYTSWKRLILYQKSKWLIRTWMVFELGLFLILLYDSFQITLPATANTIIIIIIALLVIVLSANMRWVAYLNFKQKWTSLLLLLLSFFYLGYFLFTVNSISAYIHMAAPVFRDFSSHIFNICLLCFVLVYSTFSFLVILFNLPTSSVFEQKLEEVVNFQRISQSIQTEQNEESVYNILLESSVSAVFADAAWLEITSQHEGTKYYPYKISEQESRQIRNHLEERSVKGALDQSSDKTKNLSRHLASLRGSRFRSLIAFPIVVKGETIGTLALLKELPEGFNKEMTRIVSTFANQAGISIENFRLMEEAFQTERYKEELKIAKTVQKSLLPTKLEIDADFEISAFAQSADEVGGDYYDTLRINEHQVALIIADVSGKGTTAAFHMSQMKGIFHSLAQQELDPKEFMQRANRALTFCLERGSFISATYFVVDTKTKTVRYSRAGHCPVLYYNAAQKQTHYLKDRGTALGMVRSRDYYRFVENNEFQYAGGDVMVLYTDGITEAKNRKGEEFDYHRLECALQDVAQKSSHEIEKHIIEKLYEFSGSTIINDDYTAMIIKFR
ncbi:MAG: SpoIIE family protein phosphatase [Cyclobacteriaceae bacterium]|nr:SpoIIE family protein phosphatase [Cytophagales bacterium]MBX2900961.1 SpoIIE family protein phosphatase [Cyclobacteriaceae bacterium]